MNTHSHDRSTTSIHAGSSGAAEGSNDSDASHPRTPASTSVPPVQSSARRRFARLALGAPCAATIAGWLGVIPGAIQTARAADAQAPNTIVIDNFSFAPAMLTVAVGTKVVWVNHDDIPHTIVNDATPRAFKSPPLDTDDTFAYTFSEAGTFKYFCSIHSHMTGTVVVR
ncbi:cupredoxin domain-containing protein [Pararobbsia silviterrae]|uniref:Blue (type 1) copper domain-containing protein n=1 Tax=Pararobbsia silviterrae TaxID=1792498 RepID=A0A494XYQ9_9BURK|nr:cupredoxin family copper-binding protein [Pararobbsia silviterrae]RKP55694.1 hypothetical protein D7S86_10720 [Pararobbsia silviterrae]